MNTITTALRDATNYVVESADHTLTALGLGNDNTEGLDKDVKLFRNVFANIKFDLNWLKDSPALLKHKATIVWLADRAGKLEGYFSHLEFWTKFTNIFRRVDEMINDPNFWDCSDLSKKLKLTGRLFLTSGHGFEFLSGLNKWQVFLPTLDFLSTKIGTTISFCLPFHFVKVILEKEGEENPVFTLVNQVSIATASFFTILHKRIVIHALESQIEGIKRSDKLRRWTDSTYTDLANPIGKYRDLSTLHAYFKTKIDIGNVSPEKEARLRVKLGWTNEQLAIYRNYKIDKNTQQIREKEKEISEHTWGNRYDTTKIMIIGLAIITKYYGNNRTVPYSTLFFKDGLSPSTPLMRFGSIVNFCGFRKMLVRSVHKIEPAKAPDFYKDLPRATAPEAAPAEVPPAQ